VCVCVCVCVCLSLSLTHTHTQTHTHAHTRARARTHMAIGYTGRNNIYWWEEEMYRLFMMYLAVKKQVFLVRCAQKEFNTPRVTMTTEDCM